MAVSFEEPTTSAIGSGSYGSDSDSEDSCDADFYEITTSEAESLSTSGEGIEICTPLIRLFTFITVY